MKLTNWKLSVVGMVVQIFVSSHTGILYVTMDELNFHGTVWINIHSTKLNG